ncbi:hypothetical protein [Archangium primigenium]|uniref:hypothetical protein n=1 Tax=[Archangium] primigenium TaxID=2792470 RepID=UPI00195B9FCD|nr:hypothetical protein [Archangium primigenium]MBM7113490.1 hypothetical protein [Archangium primigenium]
MVDSERQKRDARRWVVASLVGALALLGVGVRYAPHPRTPPRRRPRATARATPAPASPPRARAPEPEAREREPREDAPLIAPWVYFVLPRP